MSNSKDAVRKILDAVKADKRTSLTAPEGKLVCDAYGIPVPKEGVAKSAAEAAKLAADMGFPVVMKIVSPDILHKTEAGGVMVGVKTAADAEKNYDTILANAKKYKADAKIEGIQVQQMLLGGQEVIIGAVTDGSFGKLVAFGLGGVLVEVLKDITFRLAPATKDDALSMLDGIQAHEMLKGVRGSDPANRDAIADIIVNVSKLITDFPEISEMDLNPVFATKANAIAADVRIVVDFAPPPPRPRPNHDDIVRQMNRIMKPKSVAVIGASAENGKIGNSVMKNLINGGYKGEIYPIHPKADEIMGKKVYKSIKDVPGEVDIAVFAIPANFVAGGADRMRREESRRRDPDSLRLCRNRQHGGPGGNPGDRPEIRHPPDGAEHLRLLLYPRQSVRDLLHRLRRQGLGGAVVAIRRHRHGDHRLLALGQDGRLGDRRPRQQVRYRRGRSADLLRAGRQHPDHRAALRGPEGRPRLRRGGKARVEEEADRGAEGRPHLGRRQGRELAHRRARRQRQDLRGRVQPVRRDPRPLTARHAGIRPRHSGAADAEGRERRHHHRRRRLRRAAVGRLHRQQDCR